MTWEVWEGWEAEAGAAVRRSLRGQERQQRGLLQLPGPGDDPGGGDDGEYY